MLLKKGSCLVMACKCYCNAHSDLGFGYGDKELTKESVRTEFLQKAALLGTTTIL